MNKIYNMKNPNGMLENGTIAEPKNHDELYQGDDSFTKSLFRFVHVQLKHSSHRLFFTVCDKTTQIACWNIVISIGGYRADWVTHYDDDSEVVDSGVLFDFPRVYGDVRKVSNWRSL